MTMSDLPGLPPGFPSEDDALAVEDAIRAAVNAVMDVVRRACSRTAQEYRRLLAERDQEISRLECKLEKSESELQTLRLEAGKRQPEDEQRWKSNAGTSNYCGVGAERPTHISLKCHGTAEAFPHQHAQSETPPWEGGGEAGCQPCGCVTPPVKPEPCDLESVIKWEECEGSLLDQQEAGCHHKDKAAATDTQAECETRTANPHMKKSMMADDEDEQAARLKRKGGERNGHHLPENEEVVVKRPCVSRPSAPKIAAPKDNLGHMSSQCPTRLSNISSNLHEQEPQVCQQQTFISMSTPQPTCDPILLEVLVSLETIKQQNTTVLQILQAGKSSEAQVCEPPDIGSLPLPLQSVQDLRSLEQRILTEPELKKTMISFLSLAGGMTTKESVWRIMAKLFTNTLATNINWRGRNNKQRIENLAIKKVILNAVRQNSFCKDAVDEEIERYIKRWLQLAGDRDGGRKRRQEKGKESDGMRNYCIDEMFPHE